jgi:uncharacterized protein (TIGR03067 family)
MKARLLAAVAGGWLIAVGNVSEDAPAKDSKRLQGAWKAVAVEKDGKQLPEDEVKNIKLVVKDDQFTFADGPLRSETTVVLDPTKRPKQLDLTVRSEGVILTYRGIYSLEREAFKICLSRQSAANNRPKQFSTQPGETLYTFRPEKP